jgi:hypothetical protein
MTTLEGMGFFAIARLKISNSRTSNDWNKQQLEQATTGTSNDWNKQRLEQATTETSNDWNKQQLEQATAGTSNGKTGILHYVQDDDLEGDGRREKARRAEWTGTRMFTFLRMDIRSCTSASPRSLQCE